MGNPCDFCTIILFNTSFDYIVKCKMVINLYADQGKMVKTVYV